jgi:hypothetical protein
MKNLSIFFLTLFAVTFSSCKNNTKSAEPEVVTVDNSTSEAKTYEIAKTDAEFNDPNVEAVYEQYIQLENGLVNTDAVKTAAAASKLKKIIVAVDDDPSTIKALEIMEDTDDIEVQRHQFVALNTAMEDILDDALKSGTIYKQYCPMAFDNTGAYWFSSSKDILNPYFGDKMLKCGRVDAEVK